jgi:MFS transporter, SP family, arabinose:H+ symporter
MKKVFIWSLISAFGGFLFGLDTAVISGAEQSIQRIWELSAVQHGFTVSIALIGTVIGAMLGGFPSDMLGRRKTLFWIAVLFLVSSLGSALAIDWYTFLVFRFIGGLGGGCSSVTAPMYISEISPASHRGRLVALFQFNVVLGILIAFVSNYLLQDVSANAWRWMLGIQAFPSALFLIAVLFIPESPRWLIFKKGAMDEAKIILEGIGLPEVTKELQSLQRARETASADNSERLFSRKYAFPVALAMLMAFFNQVSGINAIIYYAPRIFEMTGMGSNAAFLSTAGTGLVNFIFTFIAIRVIDKMGRRKLMLIGSAGLIVTLAIVTRAFYLADFGQFIVPLSLFLYIAFFAFSQGAVIWVFIAEIFPDKVRAQGQALGSFVHWFMAAIIAFSFPYISESLGGGNTFLIFTGMMILQLFFVIRFMPETKGKTLGQEVVLNKHEENEEPQLVAGSSRTND